MPDFNEDFDEDFFEDEEEINVCGFCQCLSCVYREAYRCNRCNLCACDDEMHDCEDFKLEEI